MIVEVSSKLLIESSFDTSILSATLFCTICSDRSKLAISDSRYLFLLYAVSFKDFSNSFRSFLRKFLVVSLFAYAISMSCKNDSVFWVFAHKVGNFLDLGSIAWSNFIAIKCKVYV